MQSKIKDVTTDLAKNICLLKLKKLTKNYKQASQHHYFSNIPCLNSNMRASK